MVTDTMPLSEVVGLNARTHRLRHDAKLEDVARAAREYGLRWTTGRVGDLESGRIPATLPTLLALAQALGDVTSERVSLADLVHVDGWVEVNSDLTIRGEALSSALRGEPMNLLVTDVLGASEELDEIVSRSNAQIDSDNARLGSDADDLLLVEIQEAMKHFGVAEERLAKQLDLSEYLLTCVSLVLWGTTFSAERDRRAGAEANAQRRGQVARTLKAEISEYLERHSGDGQ